MMRWYRIAAAVLIVALLIGLYRAKTEAGIARARVHALQAEISETEANIHRLKAEIAAQETPARVEVLARQELKLEPGRARPLPESEMDRLLPAPETHSQARR